MTNNKLPIVSVCIPVFNGENFIFDAITSVIEQDYGNFEVVVVDNCSTDSTPEIVGNIDDHRIRYIRNKKNIGALSNFSRCVDLAIGEYFLLLPHDDYLLPGCLTEYVKRLRDEKIGLVYSTAQLVDANKAIINITATHECNQQFNSEEAINNLFESFMPIQLAMVRIDILRRVGGFDSNYGLFTDAQVWFKVMIDGCDVYYYVTPFSCLRSHEQQGQNAFQNLNLEILSDHWSKKLDKTFWNKNSYDAFFLKLIQFVLSEMELCNYKVENLRDTLLKLFISSHLRFMVLASIRLNYYILQQELLLFKPLVNIYGVRRVIMYYPIVLWNELAIRVVRNKK